MSLYHYRIIAAIINSTTLNRRFSVVYVTLKQRCCYAYRSNLSIVNVTITITTTNNVSIKEEEK